MPFDDDPDIYSFQDSENNDDPEKESAEYRRDAYVDIAKRDLLKFFKENSSSVFYQRQLLVIFEKEYFHWITGRALGELVEERVLAATECPLPETGSIMFYRSPNYRYWKRAANQIIKLVSQFSTSSFARALGAHGETMFDAALPRCGFMPTAQKVRRYGEVVWTETGHDLDRVFVRDGIAYGTEIKNTLSYIDKEELEVKVRMCKHLKLVPLFIVRMAPKSYVRLVEEDGGFTLIFKYQLYPFGQKAFADEVRAQLRLPTDSPTRIEDGTVKRLLDWHLKRLSV